MKIITKKILSLSILSSIVILNGCSSKEVEPITDTHIANGNYEEYNQYAERGTDEYGIVEDKDVDERIAAAERLLENSQNEVDSNFVVEDPSWTTKLVLEPDAFTADKFVEKEPVVTYKYEFDTKFYKEARWRSANE